MTQRPLPHTAGRNNTGKEPDEVHFRRLSDRWGFTMIPNALLLSPRLGALEKIVYTLLRHYARSDGHCFPGQARLAAEVPCSREHVNRCLKRLANFKLITIQQRGQGLPNVYWIEELSDSLVAEVLQSHFQE
jgi:hypothetical protein